MSALSFCPSDRGPSSLMKLARTATALVLVVCVLTASASAQDAKQTPVLKRSSLVLRLMTAMFTKLHIGKPVIDERFCERWVDKYLETLDPAKLYFLADDISEFETYIKKLPESTNTGNLEFFKLVSERYQIRIQSALDHALKRIDGEFDFSIDESITLDHEEWSKSDGDRIERWRLQLKYDLLVERARFEDRSDQIAFLKTRYESIRKQAKELTQEKAIGLYLDSFCRAVDPHCGYFTPQKYNSFTEGIIATHSIGVVTAVAKGRFIIVDVWPGFRRKLWASKIIGCELLAITTSSGDIHNCREIDRSTIIDLIAFGLGKDALVKLELYDRLNERRFAVTWPRKEIE